MTGRRQPTWDVWREGSTRGNARLYAADCAAYAAEHAAEHDDCFYADYTIVGGESAKYHVCPSDADEGEPALVFEVRGESIARYYARASQEG